MKKRNTPAKQLIRGILDAAGTAMSQDMLEQQIDGQADRVTIYRVLNSFCEDGIVHRIVSDEGKAYYALCRNCKQQAHKHEHAHFRCVQCQKVECVKGDVKPGLPKGYTMQNMNYWIAGYCINCNQAAVK